MFGRELKLCAWPHHNASTWFLPILYIELLGQVSFVAHYAFSISFYIVLAHLKEPTWENTCEMTMISYSNIASLKLPLRTWRGQNFWNSELSIHHIVPGNYANNDIRYSVATAPGSLAFQGTKLALAQACSSFQFRCTFQQLNCIWLNCTSFHKFSSKSYIEIF